MQTEKGTAELFCGCGNNVGCYKEQNHDWVHCRQEITDTHQIGGNKLCLLLTKSHQQPGKDHCQGEPAHSTERL